MQRRVEPELLDTLPADDPGAVRSRRDLQRVNAWMGNAGIMQRVLSQTLRGGPAPKRISELGAGDGTFALRLAKRMAHCWPHATVVLVDQQSLVTRQTRSGFAALQWTVESVQADVFDWLARSLADSSDVTLANLFLHHFEAEELRRLLQQVARQTKIFLACEPRRFGAAVLATKLLWLIGCNQVTRHDATVSVRAGFADHELTRLWPNDAHWRLNERPASFASHCFVAQRANHDEPLAELTR
jgi:hypothetical protein